ncbi:MAG: hypothetical protein AB7E72_19815 [Lysobacterales bacterium]
MSHPARWILWFFGFLLLSLLASRWTYDRTIQLWEGALLVLLFAGALVTGLGAARAILRKWVS